MDSEGEMRLELGDPAFLEGRTGRGIANHANGMTGRGLRDRKVHDVPEDSADRRANDVQDAKRFRGLWCWAGQAVGASRPPA